MDKRQELLLEEYKLCKSRVARIDSMIWQIAGIVFPITLAGLGLLGVVSQHNFETFFTVLVTGVGSICLLLTWYFISQRWYAHQKITLHRIVEIEPQLGFWIFRYNRYLRLSQEEKKKFLETLSPEEKEQLEELSAKHKNLFPNFTFRNSRKAITALFILGWVVLIVREMIMTF
ncbi:hypothetical protein [Candidatus Leptofilum sp.]|uniref:hypothetical protein n=1 Tax=Candidatus Leptofilum sp. TaxID=3241576 RepID=UPI003B5ADE16